MSTSNEYIKVISRLERRPLSKNGNPRFRIYFTDASTALTQVDGSVALGLENRENIGVPVLVKTTPSGLVWDVVPCRYATADEVEEQIGGKRRDLRVDWKGDLVVVSR